MADQNGDLLLVEEERDSDVKLGRITDTTYQKIEDSKGTQQSPQKKISSYQTVFSVWNTMIGSSILSIPYNVYCAGIIPTIIIGLLYGFICFLTCSVVVKLGGKEKDFSPQMLDNMLHYDWPGNVRELRNVMERLFVITHGDLITGQNVGSVLGIGQQSREGRQPVLPEEVLEGLSMKAATEAFQRAYILQALKRNKGNVEKTAEDLHMARSGLYKKMGQLGLKVKNELI